MESAPSTLLCDLQKASTMLELKTKKELSKDAFILASSFNLVRYGNVTYNPVDVTTGQPTGEQDPLQISWVPLPRAELRRRAANQFNTLFSAEAELSSFDFMTSQYAHEHLDTCDSLLVKTQQGLRVLTTKGELAIPTGDFIPNTLHPMLNTSDADKQEMFEIVANWLNSDEEATALLTHVATALAPSWSAVKYVLLIGEGRNGKSLLLKMLQAIFGWDNCSNVTRQQISEQSPVVCELNGKLLNIVFDGRSEYVKDSGLEKSLIAGEVIPIRRLYESTPTPVQTNALFIEGLNREPKSSDKSLALQKRLVRFRFPNVYPLDHGFEKKLLSEKYLGAMLALLIDHYVLESEVAERLTLTSQAMELQLEHMFINSLGLQFVKHVVETHALGEESLSSMTIEELSKKFQSWRVSNNDYGVWSEPDIIQLFEPIFHMDRKSKRVDGKPRKVRIITSLKPEAQAFVDSLEGDSID